MFKKIEEVNGDVLCLQEVDEYIEWKEFLTTFDKKHNNEYGVHYKQRTQVSKSKRESSLVAWRRKKLECLKTFEIEYNDLLKEFEDETENEKKNEYIRDCVGAGCLLEHRESKIKLLVVSTHLFWDPEKAFVKLK